MRMLPEKKIKNKAIPPKSKLLVAAVHPPSGGIAPGIAPIEVFIHDTLLMAYKRVNIAR